MRRAGARSQCANNLKQLAIGLHSFAETYPRAGDAEGMTGLLPAGTVANPNLPPEQRLSWLGEVLPFVEQEKLYRGFDLKSAWDSAKNGPVVRQPVKIFWCPDWGRETAPDPMYLTTYVGVAGVGADAADLPAVDRRAGVFGHDRRTALTAICDGTSQTLLILETAQDNGPWARGGSATLRGLDPEGQPYLGVGRPFGGTHFGENTLFSRGKSLGCNAAMADGAVHFLAEKTAAPVLEALATIAGGEDPGSDW